MRTLNKSQEAAVLTAYSRVAVIAGPGSGKTEVIVRRVANMVNAGKRVAVVTLTNSAADEITDRLGGEDLPWYCGTIHGLALRIVRQLMPNITVLSAEDAEELEAEACARVGYKGTKSAFAEAKRKLLETGQVMGERMVQAAVQSWLVAQRDGGMMTFDGLMHFAAVALAYGQAEDIRGMHLVVDEGQDCAAVDYRLFELLRPASMFLVGDPDQAIFGFRGGCLDEFLRYSKTAYAFPLEENYRCQRAVCMAANELIEHNSRRISKRTTAVSGERGTVCEREHNQFGVEMIALRSGIDEAKARGESVAVLCRTNQVADLVREAIGEKSSNAARLPDDWAKCRRLLSFIVNPHNDWLAALAAESIGLGKSAFLRRRAADLGHPVWLVSGMNFRPDLNWLALHVSQESVLRVKDSLDPGQPITAEFLVRLDEETAPSDDSIVMTIHKAKGREFDSVFIPCLDAEQYSGKDLDELRRLMFVALTRSKRSVFLSWSHERPSYGGRMVKVEPSNMIKEMDL